MVPSPIGVAEWKTHLTESLPEELPGSLRSTEEIEAELAGEVVQPKSRKEDKRCEPSMRRWSASLLNCTPSSPSSRD